jgi:hypothetical protein
MTKAQSLKELNDRIDRAIINNNKKEFARLVKLHYILVTNQ